jgi:hypothetical protein
MTMMSWMNRSEFFSQFRTRGDRHADYVTSAGGRGRHRTTIRILTNGTVLTLDSRLEGAEIVGSLPDIELPKTTYGKARVVMTRPGESDVGDVSR